MNSTNKHEQVWKSLRDPDFRKQFIDENVSVGLAFQIRALRDRQDLKQGDLAKLLGSKQSLVSSWENPNYGKYTLATLKDLAKAFDVGLLVRFVSLSTLVDWTININKDAIAPPSFKEEQHNGATSASTFNLVVNTKDNDPYDLKHLYDKQQDKELVYA
jgi:transcriptional regulator with XRE-family HTH domain